MGSTSLVWSNKRRKMRRRVIRHHGLKCWLCGRDIACEAEVTLDHVIPVREGGRYEFENLRPAHLLCNQWRGYSGFDPAQHKGDPK